jgi:ATP-dependent exoDNAse (exonuclease V) alpha subunit
MGVLNGAIYEPLEDYDTARHVLRVVNERGEEIAVEDVWIEDWDAASVDPENRNTHPFAWGWSCTVHKAQGSEFETGILVDEYDRQEWRREWCYTGITRFSKSVLVHNTWS